MHCIHSIYIFSYRYLFDLGGFTYSTIYQFSHFLNGNWKEVFKESRIVIGGKKVESVPFLKISARLPQ